MSLTNGTEVLDDIDIAVESDRWILPTASASYEGNYTLDNAMHQDDCVQMQWRENAETQSVAAVH